VIGNSFENVKSNHIGPSMVGVKFGSAFPVVAAAVWVAGTVAGCSFAFVQRPPPAARPASGAVGCTSTYLSPIMDSVLVALAAGYVAGNEAVGNAALRQPYTVGDIATAATFTALTAAAVVSAAYGYVEVHACREDEAVPFKPALAARYLRWPRRRVGAGAREPDGVAPDGSRGQTQPIATASR